MTTQIGQVYRHTKTGNFYIVTGIAIDASSYPQFMSDGEEKHVVIYRRYIMTGAEGPSYARPEREFHQVQRFQMSEEGDRFESLPRFQLQERP